MLCNMLTYKTPSQNGSADISLTYPSDIHLAYIAPLSGLILMFNPVLMISSLVTAANEFKAEATVLQRSFSIISYN